MSSNNLVLNRLFTQNVFQELIDHNDNGIYNKVVREYIKNIEAKSNGELIKEIYKYMSKSYRNQYFYQNTLLNKILIGKHSLNTTTALAQINIGKSKADFILINGKAVVYEIKSELDSFDRLKTQINDYYKAFNQVCVVASEQDYPKLSNMLQNTPVGIYVITKKNTISTILRKEPIEDNEQLDYLTMFKVLRKIEYESIVKRHYGKLPETTQAFYFDECFSLFSRIPKLEAYSMTLEELRNRNKTAPGMLSQVPYELKSLVYFLSPSSKEYNSLNSFLKMEYRG